MLLSYVYVLISVWISVCVVVGYSVMKLCWVVSIFFG